MFQMWDRREEQVTPSQARPVTLWARPESGGGGSGAAFGGGLSQFTPEASYRFRNIDICIGGWGCEFVVRLPPNREIIDMCAASGCARRCCSCRWVARRQHVLLLSCSAPSLFFPVLKFVILIRNFFPVLKLMILIRKFSLY